MIFPSIDIRFCIWEKGTNILENMWKILEIQVTTTWMPSKYPWKTIYFWKGEILLFPKIYSFPWLLWKRSSGSIQYFPYFCSTLTPFSHVRNLWTVHAGHTALRYTTHKISISSQFLSLWWKTAWLWLDCTKLCGFIAQLFCSEVLILFFKWDAYTLKIIFLIKKNVELFPGIYYGRYTLMHVDLNVI